MSGMDRLTAIERHADTERNRILNIALTDLNAIINGHNPDVDTSINNMVWDRLDKLACDVELLAHRRASQAAPAPSDHLVSVGKASGMVEARVSLAARQIRQTLRDYGHRCAETSLPDLIAADVDAALRKQDEIHALAPSDALREAEPNYCFNPEDWEYTKSWDARDELAESILDYARNEGPIRVSTLISGPDKWVASISLDTDGDGEADDWEYQWFDSEEAARAALSTPTEERK